MRIKLWIEWGFGCFMGLLPLGAWIFAHRLVGSPEVVGPGATRELLFFALSTTSTGLLNLGESPLVTFGGLVITIASAVCYGEFLTGEALHAATRVRFMYHFSIGLAGAALIHSAITTGTIHWRSWKCQERNSPISS
jgi:hypothetical protein